MKSYKINNLVIEANSPVEAMKLSKIMSKVKDAKCNDKHYYWNDIRQLCIKNNWYTRGTNAEYDNMFRHAEDGSWKAEQIANDIYEHSSLETNYDEVLRQIKTLHLYDSVNDKQYEVYLNGKLLEKGDELTDFRGDKAWFYGCYHPRKITVLTEKNNPMSTMEYYPSVFKAEIKVDDSMNDSDIDELSDEERKAIEDYKEAIAKTKDVKLLKLFAHILKEETEHLEELQNKDVEE